MDIVIAGAGVGGLAAALSLQAAGLRGVRIMEAASAFQPLGVGLNMLPNAVRELTELDIFDEVAAQAVPTAELAFFHRSGGLIWSEPRGLAAGYHWPQLSLSRIHLINVLREAVMRRLGPGAIQTDARVSRVLPLAHGRVRVLLEHQHPCRTTSIEADMLIGADGLHSAVRTHFAPEEGEPCWNGMMMWRGTTWARPHLSGRTMTVIGDDEKKFVTYPIIPPTEPHGLALLNWVTGRPAGPSVAQDLQSRRAQVLEHFGGWQVPWLDIPMLITKATSIMEYPMLDRDPLPRLVSGRVVLLGDAAHPMFPVGSNGATQAILDGRVLAHALARHSSVDEALACYERERLPAMTRLQQTNRQMGPERMIDIVHRLAPAGFAHIEDVISREELERISAEYAQTGGFTPATLNARPSYTVSPRSLSGDAQGEVDRRRSPLFAKG